VGAGIGRAGVKGRQAQFNPSFLRALGELLSLRAWATLSNVSLPQAPTVRKWTCQFAVLEEASWLRKCPACVDAIVACAIRHFPISRKHGFHFSSSFLFFPARLPHRWLS
jgi:hypothetical protein